MSGWRPVLGVVAMLPLLAIVLFSLGGCSGSLAESKGALDAASVALDGTTEQLERAYGLALDAADQEHRPAVVARFAVAFDAAEAARQAWRAAKAVWESAAAGTLEPEAVPERIAVAVLRVVEAIAATVAAVERAAQ